MTNLLGPALAGILIAVAGCGERDVARRCVVRRSRSCSSACSCESGAVQDAGERGGRAGCRAGLAYSRRDLRFVRRALVTALTLRLPVPDARFASFPVLAFRQYHHNPRVAGCPRSQPIGGGQVVGIARSRTGSSRGCPADDARRSPRCVDRPAPLWLLVPHVPLAVVVASRWRSSGASIPMINAPYLRHALRPASRARLRGKVSSRSSPSTSSPARSATLLRARCSSRIGLHATYAIAAVLATVATPNFIRPSSRRVRLAQEAA